MTRVRGIDYEGSEELEVTSCHCEEVTKLATRQSIVSRSKLADYSFRLVSTSGSPRAFSPRDDKGDGGVLFVIARRERSEGRGNPSCLGGRGRGCLFGY